MLDTTQTEKDIQKIEDYFRACSKAESKAEILKSLAQFEQKTSDFQKSPLLAAVIKWHKNLFLQKAHALPRAEQLLDEAIDTLQDRSEYVFKRWKIKIYISLGYVHKARWNYLDAESYLTDAMDIARSELALTKHLGEIYSLLGRVNLALSRHHQAKQYAALEKEICYQNYIGNTSDQGLANIYAYALVNYSRINRLVGLIDQEISDNLSEAIRIFSHLNNEKGQILSRLEKAEFQFLINQIDTALETSIDLEPTLTRKAMHKEGMQAGLLAAKIYRKILDYEEAETKLNELISLARKHHLETDKLMADAFFELGSVCYAIDEESKAYTYFRESAKVGMVLGIKDIIIRAFDAARLVDKYKARELLTSDLVYQDAVFVRNRLGRSISPFRGSRAKTKLFASTLFVDIVDFSRMMKRSDESLTVKMVDELIDRMYLIIYQYKGYIDKFLGDGFMAIFEHGPELSSEKAFNAIRSGADIHRALKHKNRKLKSVYGFDKNIHVRIGISSGEIYAMVLGNYIKTEFTYLGNSVNLASKLESQASNESMLIDEDTYQLVNKQILSEPEKIIIPGLGKTTAHRVLRLARMHERGYSEKESA
jgi:class 3 adenylate cyclase